MEHRRSILDKGHPAASRKRHKTYGAGIDLSPALADALGVDGMGAVDWEFVDE